MGELILCSSEMAGLPYYIENAALHVYSLEELCYYIENNVYLLEQDFMSEELCGWVEHELGLGGLAERLREILTAHGRLSEFVGCILNEAGYSPVETIRETMRVLGEMEGKSGDACDKIRADQQLANKHYVSAIFAYQSLLARMDAAKGDPVLRGNILHNMGTAYARLFFFAEAAQCYAQAYESNHNKESLRQCLYAYRCGRDENGFYREAATHGVEGEELERLCGNLTAASRDEKIQAFEEHLDELFSRQDGVAEDGEIIQMMEQWKEEYRRNCRV